MKLFLNRKNDQVTTHWSGGTTTQLAIFPADSVLKEINFIFRVSTARVEAEESVFTRLPGAKRIIMVLEGEMILEHKGHHTRHLQPFETDIFSGEWETRSRGTVTDFNLMITGNYGGDLKRIEINPGEEIRVNFNQSETATGIYAFHGGVSVSTDTIHERLESGDFLLFFNEGQGGSLHIESGESCNLILVKVGQDL
jgi:uncharacterized protein